METVTSADGTRIAFERSGPGPSLVLVHGTSASAKRWANIRPLLERDFSVVTMDRRGRGTSADGPAGDTYALQREFEDVAAVVEACAEPVILFGHSYGGLCALGATTLTERLAALILYEAPVLDGSGMPPELLDRLDAAVAADDREAVMTMFCREVVRMRDADYAVLRASPAWSARIAAAHTIPRELRGAENFSLAQTHPERIAIPTLLLYGADSPPFFTEPMAKLKRAISSATAMALDGQQHVAMDTAPDMLASIVSAFWRKVDG